MGKQVAVTMEVGGPVAYVKLGRAVGGRCYSCCSVISALSS